MVGECVDSPTSPKASAHKILCRDHAREDGRTSKGRNRHLRHLVMTLSDADKKRAREDSKQILNQRKKKKQPARTTRHKTLRAWLGPVAFEECSVFHRNMILDELRVPPLMLGKKKDPTRVYLLNSFRLDDLKHLYKRRADGRLLYLVRGSSIMR